MDKDAIEGIVINTKIVLKLIYNIYYKPKLVSNENILHILIKHNIIISVIESYRSPRFS